MKQPFCGYVVVQFYPWFKIYFPLFTIFIIIRYHTQKQRKIKFEPRIKLNHNRYIVLREFLQVPLLTKQMRRKCNYFFSKSAKKPTLSILIQVMITDKTYQAWYLFNVKSRWYIFECCSAIL